MLSIITITYNDPDGFARTVDSLRTLADTGLDLPWEHVVVDQSPWVNQRVIDGLSKEWPLVRVEVPPQGIYGAQNLGLLRSRGDILWFLNGGDALRDRDVLRKMLDQLSRDEALDLLCAGFVRVRDGQDLYGLSPKRNYVANLIGANGICHQAMLYRRRVFDALGGYATDLKVASDYEHHLRVHAAGMNVACIPDHVANYDMSGSSNNHQRTFDEFKTVHRRLARDLSWPLAAANEVVRRVSYARVSVLKSLANSPLQGWLRPIWLAWNQRKGARAVSRTIRNGEEVVV